MRHVVGVADMKLAKDPGDTIITHGLGSCLGITVHDPVACVGGMLHVMMPVSAANPDKARANPFMFMDTGLPAFLDMLAGEGASKSRWRLKVAGGAMLQANDYFAIGKRNYVAMKKILWKHGVFVDAEDVGGSLARTMALDIGSGRITLSSDGRQWNL